jgi:hypothetical protein
MPSAVHAFWKSDVAAALQVSFAVFDVSIEAQA